MGAWSRARRIWLGCRPHDPRSTPATRKAQADASNPRGSAWVSANAGSGKTFVLARRVIRLLLAGADPGRILCLTFTKAAAAEMATRVFERLGEWTTLPDADLASEHRGDRGAARRRRDDLVRARRLFARALETPGRPEDPDHPRLLRTPAAPVPVRGQRRRSFRGRSTSATPTMFCRPARRNVLARAAAEPDGPIGKALRTVLDSTSDMVHELSISEFVARRDRVRAWIVAAGSFEAALGALRDALGLAPGETASSMNSAVVTESPFTDADIGRLVTVLARGAKTDQEAAKRLAPYLSAADDEQRAAAYLSFWTTTDDKLRKSPATKKVLNLWPGLDEIFESERDRLEGLLDRVAAAECYETSAAMLRLADAAIDEYERMKTARGVLDFEDLIVKTVALLSRADASRWVHYKLDRGLDHILVDEAQDTSPRQWQVIAALVEEFFAGESASDTVRTLFAVGDEKQSIFSFQGAVPRRFEEMRQILGGRARAAGFLWTDPSLHLSFRSVPVVLDAVDRVFLNPAARKGLSARGEAPTHGAKRRNVPGRVVIWPMIPQPDKSIPEDWTLPLDHLGEKSPEVQLANRIARTIAAWRRDKAVLDTGQPIRPGGILILSRIRGAQTDAIIRALKTHNIPIAGADRLRLTEHIAVMDLMALGRVMLLPEDDLSLAALLKSPLVGMSEDDLFALAYDRGRKSLWRVLGEAKRTKGGTFKVARERLDQWRSRADRTDPHAFFARVLGADGGRRRFMERLGAEAEDVLDEFLAQSLVYEQANTPSLEGFLAWLADAEAEIKRDPETARNEVRVMTVHGAKGLEADIVFLVDTGAAPTHANFDPRVLSLADHRDGVPAPIVWVRSSRVMPGAVKVRIDELREEARDEYRRLLYVAMTRAKDRLYVCGTDKQVGDKDADRRWHALVTAALTDDAKPLKTIDGADALEWKPGERREPTAKDEQNAMAFWPPFPDWLSRPVPPPPAAIRRISPSTALGGDTVPAHRAPARFDTDAAAAMERGRIVHQLLQSLPDIAPERRAEIGARYLAAAASAMAEEERTTLLGEILAILSDPAFAPVFAAGSRAEVEIAGRFGEAALSGRIDRLAVTADHVLVVDYKTNRPAPENLAQTPRDYIAQLALYRSVLTTLYPGKSVGVAILWTDRPALMTIPLESLDSMTAELSGRASRA